MSETKTEFKEIIKEAIASLKKHEYKEAYSYIMKAVNEDPNRPEPQNLLGILYEMRGEDALARKHYRMAYVLDPIYQPSSLNLERISTLFPIKNIPIDFGEVTEESLNKEENLKTAVQR